MKKSDIFVENFRKGVAERLGLGYEDLKELNDGINYASASGYGPDGPDSGKPTFALTAEARAGALWWFGPNDGIPYQLDIADQIRGHDALIRRHRCGGGQGAVRSRPMSGRFSPGKHDLGQGNAERHHLAYGQGIRQI